MATAKRNKNTVTLTGFYSLSKEERTSLVKEIKRTIRQDFLMNELLQISPFFSSSDTYIRKAAYQAVGHIYHAETSLQPRILKTLGSLLTHDHFSVRQTVINAAGEIGKTDFEAVINFFNTGLFDTHHAVRNAVIGSVKKMGEVNPEPVLLWAKSYLHHEDKEIRRMVCHGIELRGRTHPQDILPLLKELQWDKTPRVRKTLVHVLGQIAYKKGCLETVLADLRNWKNKSLITEALQEIIDVHHRYKDFAMHTAEEAQAYIRLHF